HVLSSPGDIEAAEIERTRLFTNLRHLHGPFDIVGDVHGCFDELVELLERLGYAVAPDTDADGARTYAVPPPEGRTAVFRGDLVDRGPKTPEVLRLVMTMVAAGAALCVPGNHESKLLRRLQGRKVQITHGLGETLAQLALEPPAFSEQV